MAAVVVAALTWWLTRSGSSPSTNRAAGDPGSAATTAPTSAGSPAPVTTVTAPPATSSEAPATATVVAHLSSPLSRSVAVPDGTGGIVVAGGLTGSNTSATAVTRFDPSTDDFHSVGHLKVAVHDAAGAPVGGRPVVFGGGTAAGETATVQSADAAGTWSTGGKLPAPRSDHAAVDVPDSSGRVLVVGGFDGTNPSLDVLTTTDGSSFNALGRLVEPVRYASIAVDTTTLYVIGGEWGGTYSDAIQSVELGTGAGGVIARLPAPIGHASAFVIGRSIYLAGGRGPSGYTDRIWRIDPGTGTATLVGHLPAPESDAPAAVVGDVAYLFGGEHNGTLDTVVAIHTGP